jgi:hypothetical protein
MNEWQGKPKYSEETCPSAALATTDPTLDLLRSRTQTAAVESRRLTALAMSLTLQLGLRTVWAILLTEGLIS